MFCSPPRYASMAAVLTTLIFTVWPGMLAGGTGITPMYQVAAAILKNPADRTEVRPARDASQSTLCWTHAGKHGLRAWPVQPNSRITGCLGMHDLQALGVCFPTTSCRHSQSCLHSPEVIGWSIATAKD